MWNRDLSLDQKQGDSWKAMSIRRMCECEGFKDTGSRLAPLLWQIRNQTTKDPQKREPLPVEAVTLGSHRRLSKEKQGRFGVNFSPRV